MTDRIMQRCHTAAVNIKIPDEIFIGIIFPY